MGNQLWQPTAVALHTAFKAQDKDYNWYIRGGKSLFLEKEMKAAHYALIRDRKGDAPRIIVIVHTERIALLVGTMRTERRDYVNGTIYDTLYLEFDSKDRRDVLSSAATLLAAYDQDNEHQEYQQYEKFFLDYAETLAEMGENASFSTPPPIDLPIYAELSVDSCDFRYSEVAMFSTPESRKKCARYLKWLSEQEKLSALVIVVSTGRIGKDDLQKYAKAHTKNDLIILTLSDTVSGEIDLRTPYEVLQNATERLLPENVRKRIPRRLRFPFTGGTFVFLIGISFWLLFQDRTPPQLASLMLQSSNLMQAAQTPILQRFDNFGKAQLAFSEAVQGVALSNQACEKTDETATTWNCAVAFSSDNPNQAETLTLAVADVKDEAGNVMSSKTFTAQIESAEIRAELFDAIHFFQKDGIPIAEIQIKASAKYGVKAVSILDVPAAQTQAPEVWQAEIPLPITPKMPLTAAIRDAHDNKMAVRLP